MATNGSFLEKLTLGEIGFIEDKIGAPISKADDVSQSKFLIALVMVFKKREGDPLTMTQASALTMDEVTEMLGMSLGADDGEEDPLD